MKGTWTHTRVFVWLALIIVILQTSEIVLTKFSDREVITLVIAFAVSAMNVLFGRFGKDLYTAIHQFYLVGADKTVSTDAGWEPDGRRHVLRKRDLRRRRQQFRRRIYERGKRSYRITINRRIWFIL